MGKMSDTSIEITELLENAGVQIASAMLELQQVALTFKRLGDERFKEIDRLTDQLSDVNHEIRNQHENMTRIPEVMDFLVARDNESERSNVYIPEPTTDELAELYEHPRDCRCPRCNGEPDSGIYSGADYDSRYEEGF